MLIHQSPRCHANPVVVACAGGHISGSFTAADIHLEGSELRLGKMQGTKAFLYSLGTLTADAVYCRSAMLLSGE